MTRSARTKRAETAIPDPDNYLRLGIIVSHRHTCCAFGVYPAPDLLDVGGDLHRPVAVGMGFSDYDVNDTTCWGRSESPVSHVNVAFDITVGLWV